MADQKQWRVTVIDSIAPHALEALEAQCLVTRYDDPAAADWTEHAHAIITRTTPITGEAIAAAKHIKLIAKHGIGVDHIDLGAAKAKGVAVINTPGTNAQSVAELTVMFAIAAARNTRPAETAMRQGAAGDTLNWKGFEIAGRRIGIVGLGNVGRKTAPIFRLGFNCHVSAYDPYIGDSPFDALGVHRMTSLEALLRETDILCMHVPLTDETRGMIGAAEIDLLPKGALIVNCARGGVVDEAALYEALSASRIAAAGSDVFVQEPPPVNHPLFSLPNFLSTPHIGAATADSGRRSGDTVVQHVIDILNGHPPVSSVI